MLAGGGGGRGGGGGGKIIGSREFARYYRQRPRLGDSRASVAAAVVQAQYRRLAVPLLVSGSLLTGMPCCLPACLASCAQLLLINARPHTPACQPPPACLPLPACPQEGGPAAELRVQQKIIKKSQNKHERHKLRMHLNYDKIHNLPKNASVLRCAVRSCTYFWLIYWLLRTLSPPSIDWLLHSPSALPPPMSLQVPY